MRALPPPHFARSARLCSLAATLLVAGSTRAVTTVHENNLHDMAIGSFGVAWVEGANIRLSEGGTKTPAIFPTPVGSTPSRVLGADIDGDGRHELVWLSSSGSLRYHNFATGQTLGPFGTGLLQLTAGKYNADDTFASVMVADGNNLLRFLPATGTFFNHAGGGVVKVWRGDFDITNGHDEFAAVSSTNNGIYPFFPDTGTFGFFQANLNFALAANLNNTGFREELWLVGSGSTGVYYLPEFGINPPSSLVNTGGTSTGSGIRIGAGDVDANGVDEGYVIGNSTRSLYRYTIAQGYGQVPFPAPNASWSTFIVGSCDNDANDEIFLVSTLDLTRLFRYDFGAAGVTQVVSQATIASFQADPPFIASNQTTRLNWVVNDAGTLLLNGGPFTNLVVTGLGELVVSNLAATTTFTLIASNSPPAVTRSLVVGVNETVLPPVINEVLAANQGIALDGDGDSSDFVEFRNPNAFAYPLGGAWLEAGGASWRFPPGTQIPGAGFLRVWCSGKDRALAAEDPHTDFTLSASGETLRLLSPDETAVIASLVVPDTADNTSYGVPVPGGPAPARLATVTPGAGNGPAEGPVLRDLTENPTPAPAAGQPLLVTVRAAANVDGVSTVLLRYRRMWEAESQVAMNDDGGGADAVAGDGIWSALIPGGAAVDGEMLRWRVESTDTAARASRAPSFRLPTGSPEYHGAVVGASTNLNLEVLHRFAQTPAQLDLTTGARGAIQWRGEFHDNVFVRARGDTSAAYAKKSHKVRMNPGHGFRQDPGAPRVDEFDLNTTYTDKSYLRAVIASEFGLAVGVPSPQILPVQVRQNGSFFSVAHLVEQVQPSMLDRHGIDGGGALYKAGNGSHYENVLSFEKKNRTGETKADVAALVAGLVAHSTAGSSLDGFLFESVDLPGMVNHLAATAVLQNIDGASHNHFLHRDTNGDGTWRMIPWDLDLVLGTDGLNVDTMMHSPEAPSALNRPNAAHPFIGALGYEVLPGERNLLIDRLIRSPRTRAMLLRRIRTLVDERLATGYLDARLDHWQPRLEADVLSDRAAWGPNAHFPGTTYTLAQAVDRIKQEYLAPRLAYLNATNTQWTVPEGGQVGLPGATPAAPTVEFAEFDANPYGGDQDQEFLALRNPNAFSVDISGWTLEGGVSFTFRPGTVLLAGEKIHVSPSPGKFRTRVFSPSGGEGHFVTGPSSGHLSNFGETVSLRNPGGTLVGSITLPAAPTDTQLNLVVSEVHYNPDPAHPLSEYIEVLNISPTLTLDLNGVTFTNGIQFAFAGSSVTNLAPGARALVVRDAAAFAAAFGNGLPVAGVFANGSALNNGGETIKLEDATGSTVSEFTYDDAFPWPVAADGAGFSLVLVRPHTRPDPALPANWRASVLPGGTPGGTDAVAFTGAAAADSNGNGERDLLDYAFGNSPARGVFRPEPGVIPLGLPPEEHLTVTFRRDLAADYARVTPQLSSRLTPWGTVPGGLVLHSETHQGDGTTRVTYRSVLPLRLLGLSYARIEAEYLAP